jgi:hypothetical protein
VVKPLLPIKSPTVWTTATGTPVTTLLHVEDTWLVVLDVTELEFVICKDVRHTVPISNSIDATIAQITYPCLGMVVDEHSNVC